MPARAKLAKLLRTTEGIILDLDKKMTKISGRSGVIKKIIQENDEKITQSLFSLGLNKAGVAKSDIRAEDVYQALLKKTQELDQKIFNHFHRPDFSTIVGCRSLLNAAKELAGNLEGFYLKEEKAQELLKLNPPKNILANLGYGNDVDKMLEKEDVFEIFCALRFVEDADWLNEVFFKPYQDLKKDDFEIRKIEVFVLSEKWQGAGDKFLREKLHHMSHLKELGIVFIIPVKGSLIGEALYTFFMTLHYLYEVDWHSRLFKIYSQQKDFAFKMIKALRVEVIKDILPNKNKMSWRLIPKYLAKKDTNDWRLFEPHISPEAWHYTRASKAINMFSERFPELGLNFWRGLDAVAEYFKEPGNGEKFISFNLFDCGISFLQEKGFESKCLYHQAEELWNKIFIEYLGEEEMDKLMMRNLDKGYIVL